MMALTYIMIWMVPRTFGEGAMFTWLVTTSILFFLAYTIFSVPVTSLTYELTPDYRERTRVMAFWGFFFSAGNLAINWYSPAATNLFDDPLIGARWVSVVAGLLIFGAMGMMPAIFGKERFYELAKKKRKQKKEERRRKKKQEERVEKKLKEESKEEVATLCLSVLSATYNFDCDL